MERFFIIDGEGETVKGNEPYNLGYIIASKEEGAIIQRSFIFPEYYEQNRTALYFERNVKNFTEDLGKNPKKHIVIKSKEEFLNYLKTDLDSTGARIFLAWNCSTDWNFLAALAGEERLRKWFGAPLELSEIFAIRSPYKTIKDFYNWCRGEGTITKTGRPRCTVENVMKFFVGKGYTEEKHNGLDDAKDELYILNKTKYEPNLFDVCKYKTASQAGRLVLKRLEIGRD